MALREQIDTREDSAAAKFFRRAMLAQGGLPGGVGQRASAWGWRGPGPVARASAGPRP